MSFVIAPVWTQGVARSQVIVYPHSCVREPPPRFKGVSPFSPAHTQTCRRTHRHPGAHTNSL
jgi:hypothetical protein